MPKNTGGIYKESNTQAPWLECWRCWFGHNEPGRQVELIDVAPPGIQIVDHKLHHEVPCPRLLKAVLKNEAACADTENGNVAVEQFLKADRFIEPLAQFKIFRRYE